MKTKHFLKITQLITISILLVASFTVFANNERATGKPKTVRQRATLAREELQIQALAAAMKITLDAHLQGGVYSEKYTIQEQQEIKQELTRLEAAWFNGKQACRRPQYVATAGAPGTGKTFFLNNVIAELTAMNKQFAYVYVDPDFIVLKDLVGYKRDTEHATAAHLKYAYAKWRDASNYIANHMLVKAIYRKLNIVHGTTSSNEKVATIFQKLKERNYHITLHAMFASADARAAVINERNKVFVQVSAADAVTKVPLVIQRFVDCYFDMVDAMYIYYQPAMFWKSNQALKPIATYDKKRHPSLQFASEQEKQNFCQQLKQDQYIADDLHEKFVKTLEKHE